MISRRHIRVKVMQTLYTLASMPEMAAGKTIESKGKVLLQEKFERTLDLFAVIVLYLSNVAQYAERDAAKRASKYLPTEEDLAVNTKLAGNTALWEIKGNNTLKARVDDRKLERYVHDEWVRKIYNNLAKSEAYSQYISSGDRDPVAEKKMMQYLWDKEMLGNEAVADHFLDELPGWEDDKEVAAMLMQNFFRNGFAVNFLQLLSAEKAEYARELLLNTLEREDYLMEIIAPKLANWDKERVALIDLILLRMGVCELLYFQSIPTKVTINEYIEVAKQYSTPQSGQYLNGVLDSIRKELESNGTINKEERYKKP